MPLGSIRASSRGCHGKNIKKIIFSETIWPRAFICCVDQCIILFFINAANGAPGVHTGHAPGTSLSTIDLLYPRHLCRRVYSFRFSVRPFVCSLVHWFVSSVKMSKFWLKFLCWCISHELNIRNHSYLDYRYPIGLALFL